MSEICFECLNKESDEVLKMRDVVLDKTFDLCESCGLQKRCVIKIKRRAMKKIEMQSKTTSVI